MRRASFAPLAAAVVVLISGCASADHSWRGEFDARLEGASVAIEESAPELRPDSEYLEVVAGSRRLARKLEFRLELLRKLDPPASCVSVQKKGEEKVNEIAGLAHELPKNLTPYLQRRLPDILGKAPADYKQLAQEAEACE